MRKVTASYVVIVMLLLVSLNSAYAVGSSGFELATNSARSLGKANAVTADSDEASVIVFNPAGLTKLEGNQLNMGIALGVPQFKYEGTNGRLDEESSISVVPIPSVYFSSNTPIEQLKVGIGANAPFGLQTRYSSDGNFKYTGYMNEIKTISYNLAAAYEFTPWLSLGGSFIYVESQLKQVGKLNSNFITSTVIPGTTGLADAPFELDTDGSGVGWSVGLLLTPAEKHSIGVFYRSSVRIHYKGVFDVDDLQGFILPLVFGGSSFHTSADADITLPDSLTVGYKYRVNEKLDFEVDLGWTHWSKFDHIDITFGTTNVVLNGLEPVKEGYDDTLSVHTAVSYKMNPTWTISTGYFFYEMAASEANYSNAIPDGERHGIALGLQFNRKSYSIDLSYVAEFLNAGDIDTDAGNNNGADIDGKYYGFISIVSIGVSYRF